MLLLFPAAIAITYAKSPERNNLHNYIALASPVPKAGQSQQTALLMDLISRTRAGRRATIISGRPPTRTPVATSLRLLLVAGATLLWNGSCGELLVLPPSLSSEQQQSSQVALGVATITPTTIAPSKVFPLFVRAQQPTTAAGNTGCGESLGGSADDKYDGNRNCQFGNTDGAAEATRTLLAGFNGEPHEPRHTRSASACGESEEQACPDIRS